MMNKCPVCGGEIRLVPAGMSELQSLSVGGVGMELKPCPFCGSTSFIYDINEDGVAVECNGCLAHGPREVNGKGAEIVWNGRAEDGN